jgi:hypothetical protein
MPSLTTESSPYDVLAPVAPLTEDSNSNDQDLGDNADDANADDSTTDEGGDEGDEGDGAEGSEDGDDSADESDPAAKADTDAAAKAEAEQWKAKDGNLPLALKELIAANPAAAKRLKEMYFTNQRLMKFGPAAEIQKMKEAIGHFGGVEKLMEFKQQLDLMGGEAGFQQAQEELGAWRNIDEQWQTGDVGLADHLAQVNPDSFEKIAPAMFNKLGEVNPELYNYLGASIITNTFAQDGTITNLLLMKQALNAGDIETAKGFFAKIEGTVGALQKQAMQAPKSKAQDPKAKEWETREQQYQEKEQKRFQGDVLTRNEAWMNPKINTELASYLNGAEKKLSPNTLQRLDRAVKEEIWSKHLATNDTFMKARQKLYAQQDVAGVERLYKQYADKLFPNVVRQIAKEFSLSPAAKRAAGAPQSGGKGKGGNEEAGAKEKAGFKLVDRMPSPSDVDNKKTTFDMKLKDQFILKDGTKIQVRPLKRQ